jgi:hypothetical protein
MLGGVQEASMLFPWRVYTPSAPFLFWQARTSKNKLTHLLRETLKSLKIKYNCSSKKNTHGRPYQLYPK